MAPNTRDGCSLLSRNKKQHNKAPTQACLGGGGAQVIPLEAPGDVIVTYVTVKDEPDVAQLSTS